MKLKLNRKYKTNADEIVHILEHDTADNTFLGSNDKWYNSDGILTGSNKDCIYSIAVEVLTREERLNEIEQEIKNLIIERDRIKIESMNNNYEFIKSTIRQMIEFNKSNRRLNSSIIDPSVLENRIVKFKMGRAVGHSTAILDMLIEDYFNGDISVVLTKHSGTLRKPLEDLGYSKQICQHDRHEIQRRLASVNDFSTRWRGRTDIEKLAVVYIDGELDLDCVSSGISNVYNNDFVIVMVG